MKPKINITDPDLLDALPALKRAAKKARELSIATGTPFIVVKDGKIVDLNTEPKRQNAALNENSTAEPA